MNNIKTGLLILGIIASPFVILFIKYLLSNYFTSNMKSKRK